MHTCFRPLTGLSISYRKKYGKSYSYRKVSVPLRGYPFHISTLIIIIEGAESFRPLTGLSISYLYGLCLTLPWLGFRPLTGLSISYRADLSRYFGAELFPSPSGVIHFISLYKCIIGVDGLMFPSPSGVIHFISLRRLELS